MVRMQGPLGRRSALVAVAAVCGLAILLTACGKSDFQYVENSSEGVYIKVPQDWEVVANDLDPALPRTSRGVVLTENLPPTIGLWEVDMVASPVAAGGEFPEAKGTLLVSIVNPDFRHEVSVESQRARRFQLSGEEEGSVATLRELARQNDPRVALIDDVDIVEDDIRGNRAVFRVQGEDGSTSIVDHVVTFDAATSRSYELFFSCETRCYEANRAAINDIVDSLTVED
jgi:hypothetical protein